jgi:sialate O-acetylesterase
VKPNNLFTSGAVLQQGMEVPVWGTASAGELVTVKINGQEASARAGADGRWMARLSPMNAGGPFVMTISGENTVELTNVMVGEVWVCSGQSNMEFTLGASWQG